jgi:hypothetical protein
MSSIFVSDRRAINVAFEKEITSLCNRAERLVKNISYTFNEFSVTFLSNEELSPARLKEILESLIPYETDSSKLETFASSVLKNFKEQDISVIPGEGISTAIDRLWSCSSDIPKWIPFINSVKGKNNISVEFSLNSVKRTISHIFVIFEDMNKILKPFRDKGITICVLPLSIQECPVVLNPRIESSSLSSSLSKEDKSFLDEVIASFEE